MIRRYELRIHVPCPIHGEHVNVVQRFWNFESALRVGLDARQGSQRRAAEGDLDRANTYTIHDRRSGDVVVVDRSRLVARFSRGKLGFIEQ